MSPRITGQALCASCGHDRLTEPQRRWACRGYCGRCYRRWVNQGFPPGGPHSPYEVRAARGGRDERVARLPDLDARGLTPGQICNELGITRRTLTRYRKATMPL